MLSEEDRVAIEALKFDSSLSPSFDIIKFCFFWRDESPATLSSEGRRFLARLWVYRSFMHRGIPEDQWPIDPTRYREAWEWAQQEGLSWPGFKRLTLSPDERAHLERCLAEAHGAQDW